MIQMNVDEIMFTLQKNIELPAKFWQDFSPILGSTVEVFAEHCEVAEGVFVLDQLAAALEGEEGDTISPMASGNRGNNPYNAYQAMRKRKRYSYSATAYSRLSKAEKWSYVLQWQATQRDSMSLRRKYINRRRIVINNAMKDINSMGVEAFFCMASGNARNGSKKLHKPLIVSGEHARSFLVKIMDLMKPETGGKRVSPHIAFGRHIYHAVLGKSSDPVVPAKLKGSSMKAREKIRGLLEKIDVKHNLIPWQRFFVDPVDLGQNKDLYVHNWPESVSFAACASATWSPDDRQAILRANLKIFRMDPDAPFVRPQIDHDAPAPQDMPASDPAPAPLRDAPAPQDTPASAPASLNDSPQDASEAADNNSDDILLEDGRTLRDCRFMFAHENQEHNKFQYFINDPTSFFPHRFLWKDATHVTEEQTRKIRAKYKKMHGIPKRSCKLVTTKSPARIKKKKKKRAANAAETPARRTRPRLTAD
ncbi:hypothetical protein BC940DRAFT_313291 [Gongronella butleri]|nr:hypothetical protein BC940DRAFT_313291 [Gongronella butleri]